MKDNMNLTKKASLKKIMFNVLTILLTIVVLGGAINFYYAVGYILIPIVHELGHYFAARFLNRKVVFGGFTPFGAYILHENIENCKENAIVAIGGPLLGGLLGFIYYVIYWFTGETTFFVLSFISIMLNLINLIPVKPLDGGYIAETISPIICYLGLPFLLYLFILAKSLKGKVMLCIIFAISIYQTYDFTKKYKNKSYFKLKRNDKIKFISIYSILLLLLIFSALYFRSISNCHELIKSITRFK
ncbi:site-2 protease family protein [Crassaminicella indica]|uniref:Site-2 protease family protein n=1 Tax=Crassaminicella indica TaxID=2855394 RepID=A0ABX8RDU0_9CLOT|nr:site-2 protease family protein [Crassaminicella indica]QXM06457.1 site-2 protease family protein [Crassaminicella indica]